MGFHAADPLDTANNALTPPPPTAGSSTPQEAGFGSGSSLPGPVQGLLVDFGMN